MHDLFRERCGHFVPHELLCESETLLSVASFSISSCTTKRHTDRESPARYAGCTISLVESDAGFPAQEVKEHG